MTLFINACVRKNSRTKFLADHLLKSVSDETVTLDLTKIQFPKVDEYFLNKRDSLINSGKFDDPIFEHAQQFSKADNIIIAAPYWDLSFPAVLKEYFEQINVLGITFIYTQQGQPKGLCRAKSLTYVTTAGGNFVPFEYGFGYVKALAENFYGIKDVKLVKACGLDIYSSDPDAIIKSAIKECTAQSNI